MSAEVAALPEEEDLKRRIVEFVRGASTELSTHDDDHLPELSRELAPGTTVYVAHTPKAALSDIVRVALRVQGFGLRASPHIVARRLASEDALRTALHQLRSGGVEQVLLVAGDLPEPLGPFSSTMEVLDSGRLQQEGIGHVGICGHPEGNQAIDSDRLWQALHYKQSYAERTGLQMHIASQFGFDPDAICAWAQALVERGIQLPVHVGVAGPTPLPKLIKFAMHCGVGASLRSVLKTLGTIGKGARFATSPDEMLVGLVRGTTANTKIRLQQPHFFTFGGAVATAQWLRQVREGRFALPADGGKFLLHA